jgi:hypothetical protein
MFIPSHAQALKQWEIFERSFTTSNSYTNIQKYTSVTLTATYRAPDGSTYTLPGFWDGGNTWRIRFSPPKTGTWTYTVSSSDSQLANSSNNGSFVVDPVASTDIATNPNYRGHLKLSSNKRYFTYADNTPFFWMGDTIWDGNSYLMEFDGDFKYFIDNRKAKKFSVIQTFLGDLPPGTGRNEAKNEGGYLFLNQEMTDINPANFQWLDKRVKYIHDAGMVTYLIPVWAGGGTPPNMQALWRYLVGRYSGYNMIWTLVGEGSLGYPGTPEMGQYVYSIDGLKHLITVHGGLYRDQSNEYSASRDYWYSFFAEQHWYENQSRAIAVTQYNKGIIPHVNAENGYEGGHHTADMTRRIAWIIYTSGGHYTYGARDVWNWEQAEKRGVNPRPLLDLPGAFYQQHLVNFFRQTQWWRLAPRDSLVSQGHCFCEKGQEYIIYLVNTTGVNDSLDDYINWNKGSITVDLSGGASTAKARWFNPAANSWSSEFTVNSGTAVSFTPPNTTNQDWVLYINMRGTTSPTLTPTPGTQPTPTRTPTPAPTNTPAPNPTATPTPSGPSPTPGATTTVTYQITTGADDVNEDGTGFNATNTEGWIGSGSNTASSFTGLRFTNINVPQNATVKEAYFEVLSSTDQWNPVVYTLYADNSGNSSTFSSTSKPSQRTGTTATVNYNKDENWLNNTWRRSDNIAGVIQEIVNRSDWKSGNSVSLIAKGGGNQWGRKFFRNYEYGSTSAAKLIITYQTSSPPPEPADLDGDGDIDYIDLLRFLPNLGTTNNIFNFVGNAIVDLFDFNYLIKRL